MPFSLANNIRATLRECSVPSIVSTMFYLGFQNTFLRDVKCISGKDKIMVGPAFTVRTIPIREDNRAAMLNKSMKNLQAEAFNETESGQVLVCEAAGVIETAFLGDMVATAFEKRGVEGIVIDGSVNDRVAINAIDFPVFAMGDASLPFSSHRHIIALNEPIGCSGVGVFPGDIMVGDGNGVVAIPSHIVEEVAEKAAERELLEAFCGERLKKGYSLSSTYPPNEETMAAYEKHKSQKN